ncbi:MAG: hypothetical protein IJB23_03450 [Alistipes sp.]|nr:hypothetical protein [Alistipes sp.]
MKRLKLLLLLLFVAGTLSAQNSTVQREVTDDYVKITRIIPNWDNKHDLRIGLGSVSLCALGYLDEAFGEVYYDVSVPTFRQQVKNADRYKMPQYFTGVFSFSYAFHFRRWLQLGGTVNFAAATRVYRDNLTHKKVEDYSSYFGSIMPTARFIYLNREKVQLYSAVSLGVSITDYEVLPCYDLTLFGCSFGKSIFGFVEIGNGIGGWGRVGIGYRFNAKKK